MAQQCHKTETFAQRMKRRADLQKLANIEINENKKLEPNKNRPVSGKPKEKPVLRVSTKNNENKVINKVNNEKLGESKVSKPKENPVLKVSARNNENKVINKVNNVKLGESKVSEPSNKPSDSRNKSKKPSASDENRAPVNQSFSDCSLISDISAAIEELDREIALLNLPPETKVWKRPKTPSNLYPNLEKLHLPPTGYTPKKVEKKTRKENERDTKMQRNRFEVEVEISPIPIEASKPETISDAVSPSKSLLNFNTPKSYKPRPNPNLESTRKERNDASKSTISPKTECTISTITVTNTPSSEIYDYTREDETMIVPLSRIDIGKKVPAGIEESGIKSPGPKSSLGSKFPKTPKSTYSRSFKDKLKNKLHISPKDEFSNTDMPVSPKSLQSDSELEFLLQQISIQQTIIHQASKALMLCHTMREFEASDEQVESERTLLIANSRMKRIMEEIQKLKMGSTNLMESDDTAKIILKNINLKVKNNVRRRVSHGHFVEWFVVAVFHGPFTWVSQAVKCPTQGSEIAIPNLVIIPKVKPNFEVIVQVHSLKLEQTTLFNHEDKYRIAIDNATTCPTPNQLMKRLKKPNSKWRDIRITNSTQSSFELVGFLVLRLENLSMKGPWTLSSYLPDATIQKAVDFNIMWAVDLPVTHSGFLTHGYNSENTVVWNRRWCKLEGSEIKFWNYPQQEERMPLMVINLMQCSTKYVAVADRTVCARPRTLLLATVSKNNPADAENDTQVDRRSIFEVTRNLLSCDTAQDLAEWSEKINQVLVSLCQWNMIE